MRFDPSNNKLYNAQARPMKLQAMQYNLKCFLYLENGTHCFAVSRPLRGRGSGHITARLRQPTSK
jgi:hypothetical protein